MDGGAQLLVCTCTEIPCDCAVPANVEQPTPSPPPPARAARPVVVQPASRASANIIRHYPAVVSSNVFYDAYVRATTSSRSPVVHDAPAESTSRPDKGKGRATESDTNGIDLLTDDDHHETEVVNGSDSNGGEDVKYLHDATPLEVTIKGSFTWNVAIFGGVTYNIEIEDCILRNVTITNCSLDSIRLFNTHLEDVHISNCELEAITCNSIELMDREFKNLKKDKQGKPYLGTYKPAALEPFDFVRIEWEKEIDIDATTNQFAGLGWRPTAEEIEQQRPEEVKIEDQKRWEDERERWETDDQEQQAR